MVLTAQEMKVILQIARRCGCDRDGDIISFFVKEDESWKENGQLVVKVASPIR